MKKDESSAPVDVFLFGAISIVFHSKRIAHLLQKLGHDFAPVKR